MHTHTYIYIYEYTYIYTYIYSVHVVMAFRRVSHQIVLLQIYI